MERKLLHTSWVVIAKETKDDREVLDACKRNPIVKASVTYESITFTSKGEWQGLDALCCCKPSPCLPQTYNKFCSLIVYLVTFPISCVRSWTMKLFGRSEYLKQLTPEPCSICFEVSDSDLKTSEGTECSGLTYHSRLQYRSRPPATTYSAPNVLGLGYSLQTHVRPVALSYSRDMKTSPFWEDLRCWKSYGETTSLL